MENCVCSELITKSVCGLEEKKKLLPLMKHICATSDRMRQSGLLELESMLPEVKDPLYNLGLRLALEGVDQTETRRILNNCLLSSGDSGVRLLKGIITVTGVLLIQAGQNRDLIEIELASLTGEDYPTVLKAMRE